MCSKFIAEGTIMMNFKKKPYEWQKGMETILQNVNLEDIHISRNVMIFNFRNSSDGKMCCSLKLKNVWRGLFESADCFDLPIFICDVRIHKLMPEEIISAFEYYNYRFTLPAVQDIFLVCLDSGELSMAFLCECGEIINAE
jgi:hypothetical protein